MSFASAIAFTWNGSTVATTRDSGAVWSIRDHRLPNFRVETRTARQDMLGGEWETYAPLPETGADWRIVIEILTSGMGGSNAEGKAIEAWAEAADFFDPLFGVSELGVTRPDADGAGVTRKALCNVLGAPPFAWQLRDPRALDDPGAYDPLGAPYVVYVAEGDTRFPYWIGADLLDDDTSPAPAELAIGASPDTVTINNPGARWCGLKLTVKSGSVSGNVDGFTVENQTNGTFVTIINASHLAALEYLDWHASAPITHPLPGADMSANWRYGVLGNNLRIDPGDNTLEVTRDSGTGTATLQLAWPAYYKGI